MRPGLVLGTVLFLATLTNAQETPRFEVFGGYSFLHGYPQFDRHGWEVSGNYNLNRWLGVKLDVSGHYGTLEVPPLFVSDEHLHTFLAGPQLSWRKGRGSLFLHQLLGVAHTSAVTHINVPPPITTAGSTNNLAFAVGGAGDWNLTPHLAWRVAQVDYLSVPHTRENNLRVSTGLVFRLGKR